MKERIPLSFAENRLYLTTLIKAPKLRVLYKPVQFAIDTGSQKSFLSAGDVRKLKISLNSLKDEKHILFGGSTHKVKVASKITLIFLNETREKIERSHELSAIQTTKKDSKSIQLAEALPSILGMDFLEEQNLSLHVMPREKIAYLEIE